MIDYNDSDLCFLINLRINFNCVVMGDEKAWLLIWLWNKIAIVPYS